MKLRNKKTGEIVEVLTDSIAVNVLKDREDITGYYASLAELNEEWEDAPEEPKEYWFIDYDGGIIPFSKMKETATDRMMKQIGNYFSSREEAEQAVEKLKAWKRLKDKGLEFKGWRTADLGADKYYFVITAESEGADKGDLDLLFSEVKNEQNHRG